MKNERTSKRVSTIAGKIAGKATREFKGSVYAWDGRAYWPICTVAELKALAASALTQSADRKKKSK